MKTKSLLCLVILLAMGRSLSAGPRHVYDGAWNHPLPFTPRSVDLDEAEAAASAGQTHTFPALDTNNAFTGNNTHSGTETFTGALNSNNLATGNVANKPAVSDAVRYVTNNGNDSNDGLSWGTAKLTIAGACSSLTGGNISCSAGSGTIFLAPLFSGTLLQPATPGISLLGYSNAAAGGGHQWFSSGSFTNTQMVELIESDVNGCSAKTEFQTVQGNTNFSTDAVSGCITIPVGATEHNVNALAGYANTSSTSANGVGGYFQCRPLVNSSNCAGGNAVVFDAVGITTAGNMTGFEIDHQPQNAASVYNTGGKTNNGLLVSLFAPNSGSFGNAIVVNNAQTGSWSAALLVNTAAVVNSGNWLQVQANGTATSGANFAPPGQRNVFSFWNGSAPVGTEYDFAFTIGSGANPGFDNMVVTHPSGTPASNTFGVKSPVNFGMFGTNGLGATFTLSNAAPGSNSTITVPVTTTANMVLDTATQTLTNKTLPAGNVIGNFTVDSVYGTYRVTADQTITAGASLTAIPGLSWTMPANTALNVQFACYGSYSQATAAASDSFGIQDVTVAPTNIYVSKVAWTSTSAALSDNTPTLASTTATAIGAVFTPSAATTVFNFEIDGMIEQPSNASTSVVQIMAQFTTNNGTIKRGTACRVW